jgi:hypothetical protein
MITGRKGEVGLIRPAKTLESITRAVAKFPADLAGKPELTAR